MLLGAPVAACHGHSLVLHVHLLRVRQNMGEVLLLLPVGLQIKSHASGACVGALSSRAVMSPKLDSHKHGMDMLQ